MTILNGRLYRKKPRNGPTIKVPFQRDIDVLVYVQQNDQINQDDASSQFSAMGPTIFNVECYSSGKVDSPFTFPYDSDPNCEDSSVCVCDVIPDTVTATRNATRPRGKTNVGP